MDIVTDAEILHAQAWLAANEGIFVEPASAAGVAGLLKWLDRDRTPSPRLQVPEGGVIAITVTGHGLKDADTVLKGQPPLSAPIPATREAILALLG